MKRVILWILGIIVSLILLIGFMLFTPQGNAILKPIIQSQIDKYTPIKLDLDTFSLGFSRVDMLIRHNDDITITLNGTFSLFSQTLNLALKVNAKDISVLGELVDTPLQGSFVINTTIQGQINNLIINTTSDIAKSFTDVHIVVRDFAPSLIRAQIKDAQIKEFLAMAGFKPYANGLLNLSADFSQDSELEGNASMHITQGVVDSALIHKDFDIEVGKTTFATTLNAFFKANELHHELVFSSNMGNIHLNGQTKPFEASTTTNYDIRLSDLSSLTPLVGMPIRGSFNTKGTIKGDLQSLTIRGDSDVASSDTAYTLTLDNLAPSLFELKTADLQVDTLLWMIHMPKYATMKLKADSKISDFNHGFTTTTSLELKGTTNNAVMKKEMGLDMPQSHFTLTSFANITKGKGRADSTLQSDLATLTLEQTAIDLHKMHFEVPYLAKIPNLKKLKFLTGIELVGDFEAKGKAKLADSLYADFNTQSLGGNLEAKLENNKLKATLENLNAIDLFTMAQLPLVFSSDINGKLEYDTLTEKGTLKALLNNGQLMPSKLTELVDKYLKTDITKEVYQDAGLNATINKMRINTDIGLKSNNTTIYAQGAELDLDNGTINADLKFQIKDQYVYLKTKGNLSSPSIAIDANDLIKAETKKAIDKELNRAFDKHLKDENLKKDAQKLLKNLLK